MRKILLTGTTGQIGWELQRSLQPLGTIIVADRTLLDLADPDSIRACVREIRPDWIVNPAAYTAVDKAESEPDLAMAINGTAPGILAEEARGIGACLVHFSTDYVFDGTQTSPYRESDPTNPLGVYGNSKLAGELAIQSVEVPHLILRTCWVYSRMGKNFLLTMLRLARERQELRVVSDQVGAPTWSRLIADVTAQTLARSPWEQSGTYHLSAAGTTSWYGFTQAILALDPQRSQHTVEKLTPIATTDYPTPARRPAFSVLDTRKLQQTFQLSLPDWKEVLKLAIA